MRRPTRQMHLHKWSNHFPTYRHSGTRAKRTHRIRGTCTICVPTRFRRRDGERERTINRCVPKPILIVVFRISSVQTVVNRLRSTSQTPSPAKWTKQENALVSISCVWTSLYHFVCVTVELQLNTHSFMLNKRVKTRRHREHGDATANKYSINKNVSLGHRLLNEKKKQKNLYYVAEW